MRDFLGDVPSSEGAIENIHFLWARNIKELGTLGLCNFLGIIDTPSRIELIKEWLNLPILIVDHELYFQDDMKEEEKDKILETIAKWKEFDTAEMTKVRKILDQKT